MKLRLCTLGLCLALGNLAHAQDHVGFRIVVHAPAVDACPTAEHLTALVEERIGRPAASDAGAHVSFDAVIERDAQGYRALLTTVDADGRQLGQRELDAASSCDALDDVLTLVIASSVGVSAVAPRTQATPALPAANGVAFQVEPLRSVPDPVAPLAAASRAAPNDWSADLSASARTLTGVTAGPGIAASLALSAGFGRFRLVAAATWLAANTQRAGELQLQMTGGWGELSACGLAAQPWRSTVAFCAGLQAGALRASAASLWSAAPRWDSLVQLAPSVRVRIALSSRLGLLLAAGATVPLLAPRYSYRNAADEPITTHQVGLGIWAELGIWVNLIP